MLMVGVATITVLSSCNGAEADVEPITEDDGMKNSLLGEKA